MADKQYRILIGSDNVYKLSGMKDAITNEYIDEGEGSGILKDVDGEEVTGGGSLTVTHVDGSVEGEWYVEVTDTLSATLTKDALYTIDVTFTATSDYVVVPTIRCIGSKYYGED